MSTTQTAFSRSISTNSSGKKKRLQLFQRYGSPTWRKRPTSEYHRQTTNGAAADKGKARFSTHVTGLVQVAPQSPVGEICTEPETWKLHHYSSREVAEELCLMDGEILRKIDPSELHNGAWMKKEKDQLAPNVLAMVRASNELAMMVPSEILEEMTTHGRAKVISSFIKIASKLHRLRNYNSLKAVLAGLQCTPIFRLKKTWKEVPSKRRKKFEKLSELMSEEYNWKLYRAELEACFTENIPCIPFLGVLLTTIVQQESATTSRGVHVPLSRHGRKRISGVEMYTILEAITVRNRLEKLRKQSSAWRLSSVPTTEVKRPTFIRSKSHFSKASLNSGEQDDVVGLASTHPVLGLNDVNAGKARALIVGDSSGSDEDEEKLMVKELDGNTAELAGMGMENRNELTILDTIGGTSSSDSETTSPILLPRCRLHAVDSIYSKKSSKQSKKMQVVHAKLSDSSEPELTSSMKKSMSESMVLDEIMSRPDPLNCNGSSTCGDPLPTMPRRQDRSGAKVIWSVQVIPSESEPKISTINTDDGSHNNSLGLDDSSSLVRSNSADRIRKVTVLEPPPIEELYDAHLKEYAEVSRSLESLRGACDDLIGGPMADESPELVPKRHVNGEVAGFIPKSLSLQSLSSLDDSLESHSNSSFASSSSHSDTLQTFPAPVLDSTPDNAFEEPAAVDRPSIADDHKELDGELLSPTRERIRSSSIDDVFTELEDISNSGHVKLRRRRRSSACGTNQNNRLTSSENIQESGEQRPRLNSRAEKFRKSSYGPVRRRSRRKASLVLRLAQLGTEGRFINSDDHLFKYKFVSLRYSSDYESLPELRNLLTKRPRNTEGQNYKLSYEREA